MRCFEKDVKNYCHEGKVHHLLSNKYTWIKIMHSSVSSPYGIYVLIPHQASDAHMLTKSKAQYAVHAMLLPVPASQLSFDNLRSIYTVNDFFRKRKNGITYLPHYENIC